MSGKKLVVSLLSFSFLLTACSVFAPVKSEQTNTYTLSRIPAAHVKKTSHATTLLVNYPQSSAIYNTTQMAYSTKPFEVAYFSKSQWADTPSQMLQPLIAQTIQNTHYFRQVITPGMIGQYNYILNTQLLQIQQVFFNNTSRMRIGLKAQLVNAATGKVLASREFTVDEVADPTPYGGVIAANRGIAKMLEQLGQFVVSAM